MIGFAASNGDARAKCTQISSEWLLSRKVQMYMLRPRDPNGAPPMRNLLLAAAAALFVATTAQAGEVKFPAGDPVAVITIPDGWTAKEDDGALDVSSPEDSVYLGIEAADAAEAKDSMNEWAKWLVGQGVKVDDKTRKDSTGTINGMAYAAIDADGRDKEGPVSIFFAALELNKESQVLFTYWATKDEQQKYLPAVRDMLRSVKPVQ
jgi:hypothetical protein